MGVIGGFIHKSGLVAFGTSTLIIDADVEYYQPTSTHSSEHPVSSGWFHPLYGRLNSSGSETISTVKARAPVGGALRGAGVDMSLNSYTEQHFVYFRITGSSNLAITLPASTTGNVITTDLDYEFEEGDFINWYQVHDGGTGSGDFKFNANIVWF